MSKQWIRIAALLSSLYVLAGTAMLIRWFILPETYKPPAIPTHHPLGFRETFLDSLPPDKRAAFQTGVLIGFGLVAAFITFCVVAVAVKIAVSFIKRRKAGG